MFETAETSIYQYDQVCPYIRAPTMEVLRNRRGYVFRVCRKLLSRSGDTSWGKRHWKHMIDVSVIRWLLRGNLSSITVCPGLRSLKVSFPFNGRFPFYSRRWKKEGPGFIHTGFMQASYPQTRLVFRGQALRTWRTNSEDNDVTCSKCTFHLRVCFKRTLLVRHALKFYCWILLV